MQGLHHQQQQLGALLSVALAKDDTASSAAAPSSSSSSSATQEDDDSNRLAAINSLHRLILFPPNSVLVSHSATFLFQGFSQLLTDKSYAIRRAAATGYGALCSILCTIPSGSNGRQNHVVLGTLVDRFINWALPLLKNMTANDGSMELALESLREFLSFGDVGATERYAFPILKACQELLEDERTSLNLLHQILGVLTVLSLKFFRCFQPHFVDIVDLLLGWAMLPDLAESDRQVIMGSFLQFQKYWVSNLQFPLSLMSKFLGDMDMLLQDGSPGTPQQFRRLLALFSCFSTVLKSTASGLLEINLLEQIVEPLSKMIPKLLGCLSLMGKKFGWSKWIEDSWRCLTLLAEILREKFSTFYPLALDVLFLSLDVDDSTKPAEGGKITSFQIYGVLKTNLQLLSLQKLGLLPSSVHKILRWDSPISQLRLHPNHLVTASAAATYVFLLQHGSDEVVEHAISSLFEEMVMLSDMLEKVLVCRDVDTNRPGADSFSKMELFALIKYNLKVLLSCICLDKTDSLTASPDMANLLCKRSERLALFIITKLYPFQLSVKNCVELQVVVLETLGRISSVELLSKYSIEFRSNDSVQKTNRVSMDCNFIVGHLNKYSSILLKALEANSPLALKLKALDWIHKSCEDATRIYESLNVPINPYDDAGYGSSVWNLVSSVLGAAFDRETKVRLQVATVFDMLLRAKLVHPRDFYQMAEVVLEKLGDPDTTIRSAFVKRLSHFLPVAVYLCGSSDCGTVTTGRLTDCKSRNRADLHWRHVFALKQLPQRLQPQQLVSILSYISQRWKAPLSSWIQRLIQHCNCAKDLTQSLEETGSSSGNSKWLDIKFEAEFLEKTSLVNNLAGVWWAIHEAARYCTATRLRTNLGGPTQTFAALERMLLDVSHMLQIDSEQNDGGLSIIGSSGAHLLPMRLLLDFVEALKKNVYNAYEGSSVLPLASRQSSLFFRANKKVCEEWFSRICEPMMNAGLALQCHDAIIQYCSLRLQELKSSVTSSFREKSRTQAIDNPLDVRGKLSGDVMRIVQQMAQALSKKHESAALIGLQKWAYMSFSSLFDESKQADNSYQLYGPFSWITGLVHQAEGQYEKAAAVFTHLLQTEESLSSMEADGIQYIIGRVIESYCAISDWQSLDYWLLDLQALRAKHAGKSYSGALTIAGNEMNAIHALAQFDEGDYRASWASLDLTPKSSSELTLDPKLALQRSEQMLLQGLLYKTEDKMDMVPDEMHNAKLLLNEALTILPLDGLPEAAPYAIHLHCIYALEEDCRLANIQDKPKQFESIVNSLWQAVYLPMSVVHQDCRSWLKLLRVYQTILPISSVTLQLSKDLMCLARKQGNFGLANNLKKYLRDQTDTCFEGSNCVFLTSSLKYEDILLLYAEKKFADAFTNMWSYVKSGFYGLENVDAAADDSPLKAKACLKLSNWLKRDYADFSLENVALDILTDFSQFGESNESLVEEKLISKPSTRLVIEEIVGTATKLSTQLCPTLGKTWISYASWCFSQAKESLNPSQGAVLHSSPLSPVLSQELIPKMTSLTEDEILRVRSIISELLCANDSNEGEERCSLVESSNEVNRLNQATSLVQKVVNVIETAAGAPGVENFGSESLSAAVSSQIWMTILDQDVHLEENVMTSYVSALVVLVDIWWSLRKRRVSLFGNAAYGFMQYLSFSSSRLGSFTSIDRDCGSFSKKTGSLRATLYILHIMLNYGLELKDTLEPGLSSVPLLPWQEVTPQLFARLCSHPEPETRKHLEGLLMMLAKSSPWSVVYPTLVDVNASDEEPPVELQRILECLMKLYPRLVQDVKLMIYELGNVTVLWEELWLSTLQDLHGDVHRRINLLKEEAARISGNITLSHSEKVKINAAKYSAMMAPVVLALERRLALISKKPETPHEKWFQDEYKELIRSAILAFKNSPASASALGDVWRPFDNIAASLASYQRKSEVSLKEVAPQLARLSSSDVPMPGLEKQKQLMLSETDRDFSSNSLGIVTISSFSEQVVILPTKTKPKKLVILGSDGGKYTYLLKGREDLRLDARIMQLLQAVNSFLQSCSETRSRSVGIRYYSVTPISGRAGLIQWVDNVISIYSIFKSWQQRVQMAQLLATGGSNVKDTVPPPVPRPSDMFYGKIIPALKEKGIKRVISRRDWPHEVKLKVFLDLMKETPKQLLHQELWCASEGFSAFSSKLKRYCGSLAAMSMVGHIFGLGDRHLDNILIDFFSGDIVHIDYNVCFEKGQRLKVPEIVPFRLTQTLEAALGLTGVEGLFRANCEAVIGVLRRNKDLLLMLLEVFVWDPLVEWTRGDFHDDAAIGGEERKGMELAVSLSLFASRVQEMRVPLQEHHDLLLGSAPAVESSFERFLNILNQYELVSAIFYRADQERSTLHLNETSAKSLVSEATSLSEKSRAQYEVQAREFAQAKAGVTEKVQEATTWLEQHGRFIDALRNDSISEIRASIRLSCVEDALSLISAVSVAGVPLSIVPEPTRAQCHEIDREVSQLIAELDDGISSAIIALQAYALSLQRFLPLNYIATSPVNSWAQVLQLSINSLSPDMLSLARRQAGELISKIHGDGLDYVTHCQDDLCLKMKRFALEIEKLEEEYAGLVNSIGSEAELKAKNRILSAFQNYMQSSGFMRNEDLFPSLPHIQFKHEGSRDSKVEVDMKKEKLLSVLYVALCSLYDDLKHKVQNIFNESITLGNVGSLPRSDFGMVFFELEEQIEKCVLVMDFIIELQHSVGNGAATGDTEVSDKNWASIFKATLLSCKDFVVHMSEAIFPELIKSIVCIDSEVVDAFGALSNIRGSVETALEQLIGVEVERASLEELEKGYFVKVGLITEQQLALEEAAMKGRDHLSWEEAEELASQEEACRAQLDELHHTWNQKDARSSSLINKEAGIRDGLVSSEHHFLSLLGSEEERVVHGLRNNVLLSTLDRPFSGLESQDKKLLSYCDSSFCQVDISKLTNIITSGCQLSEYIWKFKGLLNGIDFFAWKVAVMDSILDVTIHNVSSSIDQNLGMDQLIDAIKKKLVGHLHVLMSLYIKERIAPALVHCLDKEVEKLKQQMEGFKEHGFDKLKKDLSDEKKMKIMLEEYCSAHETVRAAKSAASLLRKQVNELKEAIKRTSLEIIQMEWMNDMTLNPSHDNRIIAHKFLESDDKMYPLVLDIHRPNLLEKMQSSVSKIASSIECLQSCERTSITAEGQLERAMNWACGGPNPSMTGNNSYKGAGIPSEFHDHLQQRKKLLQEAREKAADIMRVSLSILEFEASRDGILCVPGELFPFRTSGDGRAWQQAYLNALARLEVTFHSFSRAEQELKLAKGSLEAASNGLFSASNELSVASSKAKSASEDLQTTLLQMRDCACEASIALSAFCHVANGHTALTSECGSMLEEVLAISDGLHDVHNLGKEAAAMHRSLMESISKASEIIFPLESVLSKDVAAMTDAMKKERETKMEISPIHGQAIYQSYYPRIKEAFQAFKPLVPSLVSSVKELYSSLTKLAHSASLHAAKLHKAVEGVEATLEDRSQETNLSREDLIESYTEYDGVEGDIIGEPEGEDEGLIAVNYLSAEDKGWISPPDSIYSSSSGGESISGETSPSNGFSLQESVERLSLNSNNKEDGDHKEQLLFTKTDQQDILNAVMSNDMETKEDSAGFSLDMQPSAPKDLDMNVDGKDDATSSKQVEAGDDSQNDRIKKDGVRAIKGKNAFAMSVLRRIEMKLDGRDISETRELSIGEQVDYLLKQATSADNLCNMYEGWTAWI
ncbi:LOW QUALITY PROTEIN: serine/threonine-protein kinase SMG1-like [Chenopodium quinoa]|uniref:LOW QUALITY PROTEIN: serine/threonine-protein kinase SMG1-like n=1 Tax=Chenopodium quinoa TaxID=63459 RepID=UPI000B799E75|nr:LOW QUALITY PROTEIN: serine/threonine-protein kinase SMG1-like [Chenopodium quinoa]